MSLETALQWIVVGAVTGLCVWRLIEWIMRPKRLSGGCEHGCSGCAIAEKCGLKADKRQDKGGQKGCEEPVEDKPQ